MSYVNKRTRLFLDRGDIRPERRRSEARLKTYPSSIDIRAWCDIVEDRRQHILELVYKGREKCLGNVVPLEAIVNALVAGRLADCEKLKDCITQLWQFISNLNLNDEDKQKLVVLKETMDSACAGKKEIEGQPPAETALRRLSITEGDNITDDTNATDECIAKARHQKELAEIEELIKSDAEGGTYKVTTKGPARIVTRVKGLKPGYLASLGGTSGTITTRAQGPARIKTMLGKVHSNNTNDKDPKVAAQENLQALSPQHSNQRRSPERPRKEQSEGQVPLDQSQKRFKAQPSGQSYEQSTQEETFYSSEQSYEQSTQEETFDSFGQSVSVEESNRMQSARRDLDPQMEIAGDEPESMAGFRPLLNSSMNEEEGKNIPGPRMQLAAPAPSKTEALRIQLEARETLCNELQSTLENIKTEKDHLQKKFDTTVEELETLKKLNAASPIIPTSCKEEIEALELEIKVMRSGNLSPEQEAEVIRKEVEVLKKYCLKLKSVEDENEKLRLERDTLKSQANLSEDARSEKQKSAKDNLNRQVAGISGDVDKPLIDKSTSEHPSVTSKIKEGSADIEELQNKLKNLEVIMKERDMLANKVQRLEKELLQYRDLPEDLEVYRNRSKMLDDVLEERDKMSKKVEQIKSIEDEFNQLKKKSSRVDELEEELKSYSKNDKNIGSELKKTKSKCACLEKELQNVKMERDSMRTRIEYMKKEIEMLKIKSKEAEMYRLERDKLQIKVNELSHMQIQYENLLLKCKCLESAAAEKEMYKHKYEEVITMESQGDMLRSQIDTAKQLEREKNGLVKQVGDLESCICDQEDEIKKLVIQIDTLCRNKDDNQCRMREALASMRAEIEKKDCLIAESEQKLAAVQAQLKSSIQGVSCETTCYRTRIEELERELHKAQLQVNALQKQLNESGISLKGVERIKKVECEAVCAMKRELGSAKDENKKLREIAGKMVALSGDEHVKDMLRQSECAVKRVVEELGRQYKEWDNLKHNQKKGIYAQVNRQCPCNYKQEPNPMSDSENEKLVEELEDIQREKEKLEQLVKQIQDDKVAEGPQKELISLRIENTKLQERLEREMKQRKDFERKLKVTV